jgi:Thioredoxin
MTQTTDSPITRERFSKGKTFQEYLDSGIRNLDLFQENYERLEISESQAAALKSLAEKDGGVDHMVVIGEDWCPDVYRGLGVAQRIAEAAGIELRMFERDQNNDMIQPYLKGGEFESIPVYVFYDKDHNELGHFVERPAKANDEMHLLQGVIKQVSPAALAKELGHEPSPDEIKAARAEARKGYVEWQKGDVWAGWRIAAVDEVIALLN